MVKPCGEKDWRRCSNEDMEVGGHRNIGRQRLRWNDVVRKHMKEKRWKKHKTGECGDWKLDEPKRVEEEEELKGRPPI